VGNSSGDETGSDRVKYWEITLVILATLCSTLTLADDFKTINGKEYKNATVSRVETDGIVLRTKSGISKVYFVELPKDVQERFGYDPQKAAGMYEASLGQQKQPQEDLARKSASPLLRPSGEARQNKKEIARIRDEIRGLRSTLELNQRIVADGGGAKWAAQERIPRLERQIQKLQNKLQRLGASEQ
jgi:polyhydroxyalkanoate synthesis regulator phasin